MFIFANNLIFIISGFILLHGHAFGQDIREGGRQILSEGDRDSAASKESILPVDYKGLSHSLQIDLLRGGSYEKEGISRYYFKVILLATQSGKITESVSKKLTSNVGSFGEMSLKSLDMWKRDDKAKGGNYEQRIDGDLIRDTVAKAMLDWSVPENDVQIEVQVELWRRAKRFGLLGDDVKVGDVIYQIFPQTREPSGQPPALELVDPKGTMVRILRKFDREESGSKGKNDK